VTAPGFVPEETKLKQQEQAEAIRLVQFPSNTSGTGLLQNPSMALPSGKEK
jgi:hypothetical protein